MRSSRGIRIAFLFLLPAASLAAPRGAAAQTATAVPRVHRLPATAAASPSIAARPQVRGLAGAGGATCPPAHPCPPCEGAKRRLLPDGGIETRYTDGTVKLVRPQGGGTLTTYADGSSVEETRAGTTWRDAAGKVVSFRQMLGIFAQVPYATPPDPPDADSMLARWLARHDEDLLAALRTALAGADGGAESLDRYLAREREQGLGLYGQIAARTELLEKLLAP